MIMIIIIIIIGPQDNDFKECCGICDKKGFKSFMNVFISLMLYNIGDPF